MLRHVEGGFDETSGCFIFKFVVADAKPRIPLGEWSRVRVHLTAQDQAMIQPYNGTSRASVGDFYAYTLIIPNLERGIDHELDITWQATGMVDAAWWEDVWRNYLGRTPPRFGGPPMCIMGVGDVPRPQAGSIL